MGLLSINIYCAMNIMLPKRAKKSEPEDEQ